MVSKVLVALCLTVAVVVAVPAQPAAPGGFGPMAWGAAPPAWAGPGAGAFMPPWIAAAPWMPKWAPCTTIGADCLDCNTKVVCTKIGGIEKVCSDPTLPYCNLGKCSATPSAECTPESPAVPLSQTV